MERAEPFSIEAAFDRVRFETVGRPEWVSIFDDGTTNSMSRLDLGDGFCLLCVRYEVPYSIQEMLQLYHPEVCFSRYRMQFDEGMKHCFVEEDLAPGDAIVHFSMKPSHLIKSAALLSSKMHCAFDFCHSRCRARYVCRREFPLLGHNTVVIAPLHPDSGEPVEELGAIKARVWRAEPHSEDPSKCVMTQLYRVPSIQDEVMSLSSSWCHEEHRAREAWLCSLLRSKAFVDIIRGPDSFVVVNLRKCSNGPPLLPWRSDPAEPMKWQAAATESFSLPAYLCTLLSHFGIAAPVYDTLDGMRMVPYQAAMKLRDWEHAWRSLCDPWKEQQAAYRRLSHSSSAPNISVAKGPRFLALEHSKVTPPIVGDCFNLAAVKNTFLAFPDGPPGLTKPRASSFSGKLCICPCLGDSMPVSPPLGWDVDKARVARSSF